MTLQVIFDGTLNPEKENITNDIISPKFLLIHVIDPILDDSQGEGLIIGLSVNIRIPVIGTELIKYVPHTIFDSITSQDADTANIIYLPDEVTSSPYFIYCGLNPSRNCTLRIYAEVSECGNCEIVDRLEEIRETQLLNSVQQTSIALNQSAQNTALLAQSVVLGIVGAPLTAGATLALPEIVGSTLAPTTALLGSSLPLPRIPGLPDIPLLPG